MTDFLTWLWREDHWTARAARLLVALLLVLLTAQLSVALLA